MTTLTVDENKAYYQIRSFKPGLIQVNEKKYNNSLIISPNKLIENWQPQVIAELTKEMLSIIKSLQPDILLIGTGSQLIFIPCAIYDDLIKLNIGVEIMDTSAACRTYNALSAEERNVAAALIIK